MKKQKSVAAKRTYSRDQSPVSFRSPPTRTVSVSCTQPLFAHAEFQSSRPVVVHHSASTTTGPVSRFLFTIFCFRVNFGRTGISRMGSRVWVLFTRSDTHCQRFDTIKSIVAITDFFGKVYTCNLWFATTRHDLLGVYEPDWDCHSTHTRINTASHGIFQI